MTASAGRREVRKSMMQLKIIDGKLYLDGTRLTGVSHYVLEHDASNFPGVSTLTISMRVTLKENDSELDQRELG